MIKEIKKIFFFDFQILFPSDEIAQKLSIDQDEVGKLSRILLINKKLDQKSRMTQIIKAEISKMQTDMLLKFAIQKIKFYTKDYL